MGRIEITDDDLVLHQKGKDPICWPLRSLRRYGFDAELFSFESGRRCPTGQGIYAFKCQRAEALFNLLQECIQRAGQQQQPSTRGGGGGGADSSLRPTPPRPWPAEMQQQQQSAQYINSEAINTADLRNSQHQYVNTVLNGDLHYAQLDLVAADRTEAAAADEVHTMYVNVGDNSTAAAAVTTPELPVDVNYIQVEIVSTGDSVPSSPAANQTTTTYQFPAPVSTGDNGDIAAAAAPVAISIAAASATDDKPSEEKYAIIDFDKTYAINLKSNHDEGVRKTRHNSNLEDCA